ncbi:unnamed protein product [Dovyalis caffra]|uniref:Transmembrane protein 192 n=1 Tax=Dovyalis caffra TaxID=77055 RepID=A0AAV1SKB4_9ROSI|nr:unnamed protein product [Dovyalis caffra]
MSTERHGNPSSTSREENDLFLDILQEAPLFGHRKSRSVFGAIVYCVAGYAVLAAGAPYVFRPIKHLVPSLLCSCDVVLLILTEVKTQYMLVTSVRCKFSPNLNVALSDNKWETYKKCLVALTSVFLFVAVGLSNRLLQFQPEVEAYRSLTFCHYCICQILGTATMLLVMVWKPYISILSVSTLLRIIMLTEAICAASFMSVYIGYLHRYNSLNSEPDILKSLYSPLQQSSPLEGLRYHDGSRLSDQQMALLQYQRENLHFLSEEVLRLQECLSKYERSDDGSTPQYDPERSVPVVDLAHLLAAREQELRTLSAEALVQPFDLVHLLNVQMNQLQSELRLARSVIAERDSELQRVRTTNNQSCNIKADFLTVILKDRVHNTSVTYMHMIIALRLQNSLYVEENERLRAILGEWSTRAAKLERALEVERMSNLELQKKISTSRNQSHLSSSSEQHRT